LEKAIVWVESRGWKVDNRENLIGELRAKNNLATRIARGIVFSGLGIMAAYLGIVSFPIGITFLLVGLFLIYIGIQSIFSKKAV
jgi:hypothetical protein